MSNEDNKNSHWHKKCFRIILKIKFSVISQDDKNCFSNEMLDLIKGYLFYGSGY